MKGAKDTHQVPRDPPCIGCPEQERCKREALSCAAFNDYISASGRKPPRGNPSRKFYQAMFAEEA